MNFPCLHSANIPGLLRWYHLAFILIFGGVLIGANINGSWRFDDPLILQFVQELPDFHSAFIDPAIWIELGVPFFTPILTLIFQISHHLFGLHSAGFYLLHILVLLLIAVLTYVMVASHASPLGGLFAAMLFLLGAPTTVVAAQLMTVHYAWGLLLALLSVLFWQSFQKHRKWKHAVASAGFYLLAMLGKEIFAPLPLVFFILALLHERPTVRALGWHAMMAALYVFWRMKMIGSAIGGYGEININDSAVISSMQMIWQIFWGQGWTVWVGFACIVTLAGLAIHNFKTKGIILLLCLLFVALLPFGFINLSPEIVHFRLAFLPWWIICFCAGFALSVVPLPGFHQKIKHKKNYFVNILTWTSLGLLFFVTFQAQQHVQSDLAKVTHVYDTYSRFALAPHSTTWAILNGYAASDLNFQYGLRNIAIRQGIPQTMVEAFDHQGSYSSSKAMGYIYDDDCKCILSRQVVNPKNPMDPLHTIRTQIRSPLTPGIQWELKAPESTGTWYLQIPRLGITAMVPAHGATYYSPPPWLTTEKFRVVWRRADGEWTQTPLLAFPTSGQMTSF